MNDRERRLILAALDPDMSDSAPLKHDNTMPAPLAAAALNAASKVLWSTATDLYPGDSLNSMVLTERCQAFADALDVIATLGHVRVDWFSGRLLLLDTATRIYDREAVAS